MSDDFAREFKNTLNKNSGAGNSAWEEAKGIKYATSEQRLFEIMENVCGKSRNDCAAFVEEHEELVEDWWRKNAADGPSKLYDTICVKQAKVCCAAGTFGKSCKACPGGAKSPCSVHGTCDGAGTRGGKGKCKCHSGYTGKSCSKCKKTHFRMGGGETDETSCVQCNAACSGGCTGPGTKFCKGCATGYKKDESGDCIDINECAEGSFECDKGKHCENTAGNYTCANCDVSCHKDDGCTAAGPTGCAEKSCADGYEFLEETGCTDVDECKEGDFCPDLQKYCYNKPGTAVCLPCAKACADEKGCTDGTPEGCNGCATGYLMPEGKERGCEDVDECLSADTCGENFTCRNTRGSFECNCVEPNYVWGEKCMQPDPDAAADDAATKDGGGGKPAIPEDPVKDEL